MAMDTIVLYRLMLVDKRPSLLGVTEKTGFVHRSLHESRWSVGTMRVVTVGASDSPFPDRMTIGLIDLHFFPQVTGKTDIRLAYGVQHHVPACMHGVAGYTTQVLAGVRTVSPIYVIPLVTRQAKTTLCFSTRIGLRAKTHSRHFLRVQ